MYPPPKHFYKFTNTLLISKEFYSLSSILEGKARAGYLVTLLPGNPCRPSQEIHRLEWAGPLSHVLRIPDQAHDSPPSPTLLLIHSPTSCWPEQQPANQFGTQLLTSPFLPNKIDRSQSLFLGSGFTRLLAGSIIPNLL